MSTSPSYFLALEHNAWHLARVTGNDVDTHTVSRDDDSAYRISEILGQWEYDGRGVCLGLPSEMVFAVKIELQNLPRKVRRPAMLYNMEEQLPVEAERLTADFLAPFGGQSLALAVITKTVRSIIDMLTGAGMEVVSVCSTALLAAGIEVANDGEANYVVVSSPDGEQDLIKIGDSHPTDWYSGRDGGDLDRNFSAEMLSNPFGSETVSILTVGDGQSVESKVFNDPSVRIIPGGDDVIRSAAIGASRTLAGRPVGWADFRRDDLAPERPWGRFVGLIRSSVILGVVLLLVLVGTFYCRGMQYRDATEGDRQKQISEYLKLYPNSRQIPPSVKKRLQSEHRRLSAKSGTGTAVPDQASALESLRNIVANLPGTIRLRIKRISINHSGILMEGQARNHSDAETICQAVKRGGFDIESPRTENLARGGVSFTLAGKLTANQVERKGAAK